MYVFKIDDPNVGFGEVLNSLADEGITSESRNGPVIRFPRPVTLHYTNPRRRILDHPIRDANHFFHLFETIWMFAGLRTVAPLDLFNSGMKQYSDDGVNFEAAYGFRWRKAPFDQLDIIVTKLKADPLDRRIVLQIWDPQELRKMTGKDFACNQQVLFTTRPAITATGEQHYILDITVTNRSNDLVYGAMGSNLFHFSMLHEYIAYHADMEVGSYYQMSVNMHLYLENETSVRCWDNRNSFLEPAVGRDTSLGDRGLTLSMGPLREFVENNVLTPGQDGEYLDAVVKPIVEAYRVYKTKSITGYATPLAPRLEMAKSMLLHCQSTPLRNACTAWFDRRKKAAPEQPPTLEIPLKPTLSETYTHTSGSSQTTNEGEVMF